MKASKHGETNHTGEGEKKPSAKKTVVVGDVVERKQEDEGKKEDTIPQLKGGDDDDVDLDKKPAAITFERKETTLVVGTMAEAKYSAERMAKALVSAIRRFTLFPF